MRRSNTADRVVGRLCAQRPDHTGRPGARQDGDAGSSASCLRELAAFCEVMVIAGNHDRQLRGEVELVESWQTERILFPPRPLRGGDGGPVQIIGHHHPAGVVRDGAGLRLKLPGLRSTGELLDHAGVFTLGGGTRWAPDEREPRSGFARRSANPARHRVAVWGGRTSRGRIDAAIALRTATR